MSSQAARQQARRRVVEAVAAKRKQREAQERRLQESAVKVLTAIAERDQAVTRYETVAGEAIGEMLAEGLSLDDIATWCDGLDAKEVGRLHRRLTNSRKPATLLPGSPAVRP